MQALYSRMASQANAHFEFSTILQKPLRTHRRPHVPYIPDANTPSTLLRVSLSRKKAQSIPESSDESTEGDDRNMKRTKSVNSMRRLVSGMKSMLPLKLSALYHTEAEWPPSPSSIQRSTFSNPVYAPSGSPSLRERRTKCRHSPTPMPIPPERYRDTPIYSDLGSPLLGRAHYSHEHVCFNCSPPGSSCNESCIFNGYETSSDEGSDVDLIWLNSVPDNAGTGDSSVSTVSEERSSDLSFKCRGESDPLGTQLYRDEAAWLSSSSPRSNTALQNGGLAVMTPEHDVESWLIDTSSYDGDNDDVLVSFLRVLVILLIFPGMCDSSCIFKSSCGRCEREPSVRTDFQNPTKILFIC